MTDIQHPQVISHRQAPLIPILTAHLIASAAAVVVGMPSRKSRLLAGTRPFLQR